MTDQVRKSDWRGDKSGLEPVDWGYLHRIGAAASSEGILKAIPGSPTLSDSANFKLLLVTACAN